MFLKCFLRFRKMLTSTYSTSGFCISHLYLFFLYNNSRLVGGFGALVSCSIFQRKDSKCDNTYRGPSRPRSALYLTSTQWKQALYEQNTPKSPTNCRLIVWSFGAYESQYTLFRKVQLINKSRTIIKLKLYFTVYKRNYYSRLKTSIIWVMLQVRMMKYFHSYNTEGYRTSNSCDVTLIHQLHPWYDR